MPKEGLFVKAKEFKSNSVSVKDLEMSIGRVSEEIPSESMGPTPYPDITDLREWDFKLLQRYKPFYLPFCDVCCLCTFGKCDLTGDKRGACGLNMAAQQARIVLLACSIGASTHTGHARHLLEHLIEQFGRRHPIDVGGLNVDIDAPVTQLVTGLIPKTLGDLEDVLNYCETEVTHLLSACHTGQEGSNIDFESKALHAGMVDQVGMEVADMIQISTYNFPKGDKEAPLTEIGFGTADVTKPIILVIGHNVPSSIGIIDYLTDSGIFNQVEVVGICCTAIDVTRYSYSLAKIVGPISWQLRYIRSGLPDVIVVDEQCIRADSLEEGQKVGAPVIASSPKNCLGLQDRTKSPEEEIISDLVEGKIPGALILDPEKVGKVAVETALAIAPKRKKFKVIPEVEEIIEAAKKCRQCDDCMRACPNNLPIPDAMKEAAKGNLGLLAELLERCVGCARCEGACPNNYPLHSFMVKAGEKSLVEEKFKIRVG
ncbi:MAG: 4Fe-4S dicluster domain-containing protein, partial [Candidatus Thorarchaeota archaeon]